MVPRHRGSDTGDPAKRVAYVITHEIKTRHVSLLDFALLSVEKVARFRSEESIIFSLSSSREFSLSLNIEILDEILRSWIGEVSFFLSFLLSSVDPRGICRVMRVTRRSWKATVPRCWRIVILLCAGRHFLLPSWATSGKKEHGQSGARFVSTVSDSRRRSAPWKLNAPRSRFYLFPFPLSFLLFFFRIEYSRLGISKKKRGEIAYVASKSSSLFLFFFR